VEESVSRELRDIPVSGPLSLRHHNRPVQFANLYVRSVA